MEERNKKQLNQEMGHGSEVNTAGYTTSVMIGTSVEIHKTK